MEEVQAVNPKPFVMTSWHETESIEEIAEFFVKLTTFDDFAPTHLVIIGIGTDASMDLAHDAVRAVLDH